MAQGSSRWRRWLIRAAGSALLLAVLFWLVPWDAFVGAVRRVPPLLFLAVCLGFLALHVVAAGKFWWLIGRRLPFGLALRAHFAGLAANLGLPGAIGGDAVRAAIAHVSVRDGARTVAAAASDRLIDLAALGTLTVLGLALAGAEGGPRATALTAVGILAVLLATVAALPRLLTLPWRLLPSLPGRSTAEKLRAAFIEVGTKPGRLVASYLLSVAIQGGLVLLAYLLAAAAGLEIGLWPWLFAWPLAKILAVLPVSLNGLGLREGVLATLLVPFGADTAVVLAAGLMWQVVLFAGGAVGGAVWATTSSAAPTREVPE